VVGGTVFIIAALNCSPCSLSLTHQPSATSHSPAVTEGSDPTTVVPPPPPCLYAQDAETAVVVVESDPLDYTGDFLGRGSAFTDCGVHLVGSHFPTDREMVSFGCNPINRETAIPDAAVMKLRPR
jgi:hypothetical protein